VVKQTKCARTVDRNSGSVKPCLWDGNSKTGGIMAGEL